MKNAPSLFGLKNSNRDFSKKYAWGKNQFNSSFPASLVCYMQNENLPLIYLELDKEKEVRQKKVDVKKIFGINLLDDLTYFAFEASVNKYQPYVIGSVPRMDFVICSKKEDALKQHAGLEVKLTALPDNTTADLKEEDYGTEIVVRPDTIVYLALMIVNVYKNERGVLKSLLRDAARAKIEWESSEDVAKHLPLLKNVLDGVLLHKIKKQEPLLLQPIWKTEGKTLVLADNCFDVFVWSNFSLTRLFTNSIGGTKRYKVSRQGRTLVWVIKMLEEYSKTGKVDYREIIDNYTYDTKNDKAFAISGYMTHKFMSSEELHKPRLKKGQLKHIILGGGEKMLSPERRFDAAIMSQGDIF